MQVKAPVKPKTIKDVSLLMSTLVLWNSGMEWNVSSSDLSKEYDDEINQDIEKIRLWSLDIETASENGFPQPHRQRKRFFLSH